MIMVSKVELNIDLLEVLPERFFLRFLGFGVFFLKNI